MKSRLVFLYIFSAICLCVIVIMIITKPKEVKEEINDINQITEMTNFDFESLDTIGLYRSKTGEIEEVNINNYLLCTVASEMPFKFEYEALKAQAIISRTYLYNKIINNKESIGDVCDNYAHCQAYTELDELEEYWKNEKGYSEEEIKEGEEKIKRAIVETDGKVIMYQSVIIDALFHASSPNGTEDASAIWLHENVPYLKAVESVEDEDYDYLHTTESISYATFKNTLIDKGYIDDLSIEDFRNISIAEYTKGGRVKNIKCGNSYIEATDLRTMFGIKSTDFTIQAKDDELIFNVSGFGHGIGLSQVGANGYARRGMKAEDIIRHYYTGVEVVDKSELYK